jgi:hypothetical protein
LFYLALALKAKAEKGAEKANHRAKAPVKNENCKHRIF